MIKLDPLLVKIRRKRRTWNLCSLLVIKCSKYWDKFLSFLFSYSSRCYCRASPLEIEKLKNPCISLRYFSDNFGRFSTSDTLIGKVSDDPEDLELTQHLLKITFDQVKSPKLCELMTAEILTKILAYRELKENHRISVPTLTHAGQIEYIDYTIDTVFDLWHKHVAFGLVPLKHPHHPSILLFRGTNFSLFSEGGRASLLADLDPDGPGKRLFHNSRSSIRQWLMQLAHSGRTNRVMGHSLGGILAIYTAIYEYHFLSQDPNIPSYAFNPPGISDDLLEEWHTLKTQEKPVLKTFITRGDLVSKFGSLLEDTYEMFSNKPLSPMIAHEQLIFAQPLSYLVKVDDVKENQSRSRSYYSKIQRQGTSFAYRFGLKYLFS